jgi:hypothetical protein
MSWRFKFTRSFSLGLLLSLFQSLVVMPRSMAQVPSEKVGVGVQSCTDEQIDALVKWWHLKVDSQQKLAACGESAIPHLIQILRTSPDVWSRQNVARFLGQHKSGSTEITKSLINAIETDQSKAVRKYALASLVDIDPYLDKDLIATLSSDQYVVQVLLDRLITFNDDSEGVVHLLGEIGGPEVTDRLIEILNTKHEVFRERAIKVLGKISGPKALSAVVSALFNQSLDVRYSAVQTLANNRSEASLQALEQNKATVSKTLEEDKGRQYHSPKGTANKATQYLSRRPIACRLDWFAEIWPACK